MNTIDEPKRINEFRAYINPDNPQSMSDEANHRVFEELAKDLHGLFAISRGDQALLELVRSFFKIKRIPYYQSLLPYDIRGNSKRLVDDIDVRGLRLHGHEIMEPELVKFMYQAEFAKALSTDSEQTESELIHSLIEEIVIRDTQLQAKLTQENKSTHESFIWLYLIKNRSHASEFIRMLISEMRIIIDMMKISDNSQLGELVEAWEAKHPGQSFWVE